jgi:hypothetical protein
MACANNDLVTEMKATTRTIKSKEGKEVERVMKKTNLASDDATRRKV